MPWKRLNRDPRKHFSTRSCASDWLIRSKSIQGTAAHSVHTLGGIAKVRVVTPESKLFRMQYQLRVRKKRSRVITRQASYVIGMGMGEKDGIDLRRIDVCRRKRILQPASRAMAARISTIDQNGPMSI